MFPQEQPLTIRRFGEGVLGALRGEFNPSRIEFRGSFASGLVDDYSDVDIRAEIHAELNQRFFERITCCLEKRFGRSSIRYVPDQRYDPQAQNVRISFYDLPIFWRTDLDIVSSQTMERKWPDPFPDWSLPQSAFWNLVWAVKYSFREQSREKPDHYVACACEKLQKPTITYSKSNALTLLEALEICRGMETVFIAKLRNELDRAQ